MRSGFKFVCVTHLPYFRTENKKLFLCENVRDKREAYVKQTKRQRGKEREKERESERKLRYETKVYERERKEEKEREGEKEKENDGPNAGFSLTIACKVY